MYLTFSEFWKGRCGNVVVRKTVKDTNGPDLPRFLIFFFFLIGTLSITSEKFFKCLNHCNDYERDNGMGAFNYKICCVF